MFSKPVHCQHGNPLTGLVLTFVPCNIGQRAVTLPKTHQLFAVMAEGYTMELAETLRELETELLKPSTRKNAAALASMLADEFREYGSSGRMFSKADIIDLLQSESSADICTDNFEAQILATGVALVTYRAVKKDPGSAPATSLRSSIWIFRDDRWQMLFHQGTKVSQSV